MSAYAMDASPLILRAHERAELRRADTPFLLNNNPGPAARTAKNVPTGPGLPNQTGNDSKGRVPMVEPAVSVSWSEFSAAVDYAYARGYAYGRLDQRWADGADGPLVHSGEFVTAALERHVPVGDFPDLFAELQAEKDSNNAAHVAETAAQWADCEARRVRDHAAEREVA